MHFKEGARVTIYERDFHITAEVNMVFNKKVLILKDCAGGNKTGVIKVTQAGSVTDASINLCGLAQSGVKVLLGGADGYCEIGVSSDGRYDLKDFDLEKGVDCVVLDGADKALLYGSSKADKIGAFALLDNYKHRKSEKESDTKKENDLESTDNAQAQVKPDKPIKTKSLEEKKTEKNKKANEEDESKDSAAEKEQDANEKEANNPDLAVRDGAQKQKKPKAEQAKAKFERWENEKQGGQKPERADKVAAQSDAESQGLKSSKIFADSVRFNGTNFYNAVKPQLDEMFICYPEDKELTDTVPNSRWVRVGTDSDYYVVGIISELDEACYICYGIYNESKSNPPSEIAEICEWLPLSLENTEGRGYWIIYQSAKDGQTITAESVGVD